LLLVLVTTTIWILLPQELHRAMQASENIGFANAVQVCQFIAQHGAMRPCACIRRYPTSFGDTWFNPTRPRSPIATNRRRTSLGKFSHRAVSLLDQQPPHCVHLLGIRHRKPNNPQQPIREVPTWAVGAESVIVFDQLRSVNSSRARTLHELSSHGAKATPTADFESPVHRGRSGALFSPLAAHRDPRPQLR
jgi:hypothetical protein